MGVGLLIGIGVGMGVGLLIGIGVGNGSGVINWDRCF